MKRFAVFAIALAGCLDVPSSQPTMCASTADCGGHGEVCEENVCYGDPPPGPFAAVVSPPSSRADLVTAEVPLLDIPPDGLVTDLALAAPLTFAGRVEIAGSAVSAHVVIARPSRFLGGPGFNLTIASSGDDNGTSGDDAFKVGLPATTADDQPYEVTIAPDDDPQGGGSPATLAPPMRLSLALGQDTAQTFTLDGDTLPHLRGTLFDAAGAPLTGYRIVALGRWSVDELPSEVSTVDYSADGSYDLTLSDGLIGSVEIVASPFSSTTTGATLPTLHLSVDPTSFTNDLYTPGNLGGMLAVSVVVTSQNGDGTITPVIGATVSASGLVVPSTGDPNQPAQARASLDLTATTDNDGIAHLAILDGFPPYSLSIVPPVNSTASAAFAKVLDPTVVGVTPPKFLLPTRISLHGIVVDSDGKPISGITVTAKPSLRYRLSLDAAAQDSLAHVPAPTAVTRESGDFAVFVDPAVAGLSGLYDLDLEPATNDIVPHWTVPEVSVQRDSKDVALGSIAVPAPSFVHGLVTDPAGGIVDSATIGVYQIISDESPCMDAVHAPSTCVVPAIEQAHATADANGVVRFTLPRP